MKWDDRPLTQERIDRRAASRRDFVRLHWDSVQQCYVEDVDDAPPHHPRLTLAVNVVTLLFVLAAAAALIAAIAWWWPQ